MKIVGLPIFLWDKVFLKNLDDACRGFVAIDIDAAFCWNLLQVSVLIKIHRRKVSRSLQVGLGKLCYSIQ